MSRAAYMKQRRQDPDVRARQEAWYQANRERLLARQKEQRQLTKQQRATYIRRYLYGLTEERYNTLLQEQFGRCQICSREKKLVVDHNHTTGAVRGLLCMRCNTLLPLAENAELLSKALDYLKTEK